MSVTKESILKAILLQEFDRMQPEISTFEDDPMQFILRKYQGLNKVLTYLMTPSFEEYITGIYIVAPKPTTFKIVLHNGQFFFLQFMGKAYQATVAGKNYYLMNIGEKERCMLAIARILRFGNPLKTKGPEGAEQSTREGGEEGGGESGSGEAGGEAPAAPEPGGGEEETIAESRILEEILKKTLYTEKFRELSFGDLKKRDYRFDIIYNKIENKKPFLVGPDEKSAQLKFANPEHAEAFKSKNIELIRSLGDKNINKFKFFVDDQGNKYSISDLLKDKDFGGKGSGSGTVIEDYNFGQLKDSISKLIEENGGPITIVFKDKKYPNIIGVEKSKGFPKADFYLINQNKEGVFYISHKKAGGEGASANDFIRWSGYTAYKQNPEVDRFITDIKNEIKKHPEWNGGLPNKTNFISKIEDAEFIKKLIYGSNYGESPSLNSVNAVFQGAIKLTPKDSKGEYEISAEKEFVPPEIPSGDYTPYLVAKYRSDRSMFGIKNNESIVMTKTIANAASNVYELTDKGFVKTKPDPNSK